MKLLTKATGWGGGLDHPPFVIKPASTGPDLIVTSSCLVRDNFSPFQHVYNYIGDNRSSVPVTMQVAWNDLDIEWTGLGAYPITTTVKSFFSPVKYDTFIDAHVINDRLSTGVVTGVVTKALAPAFIPWFKDPKAALEAAISIKKVLSIGAAVTVGAITVLPGNIIEASSSVVKEGERYIYKLHVHNHEGPLAGDKHFSRMELQINPDPSEVQRLGGIRSSTKGGFPYEFTSDRPPRETKHSVQFSLGYENEANVERRFKMPFPLFMPEDDQEVTE